MSIVLHMFRFHLFLIFNRLESEQRRSETVHEHCHGHGIVAKEERLVWGGAVVVVVVIVVIVVVGVVMVVLLDSLPGLFVVLLMFARADDRGNGVVLVWH